MYFIGIDSSKCRHDCFIITDSGEIIANSFSFNNDRDGFNHLLTILNTLIPKGDIRIGFEATGYYAFNLKLFLEEARYSFMEFNPVLLTKFIKSQSLRRTKTDAIDAMSISHRLMTVEYKLYPIRFYHTYALKSLTRLRDTLIKQRSFYIVKLTNILDCSFMVIYPSFNCQLKCFPSLVLSQGISNLVFPNMADTWLIEDLPICATL